MGVGYNGKVFVKAELPNDYFTSRWFSHDDGLATLEAESFYVITEDKKILKRVYEENGFTCIHVPVTESKSFIMTGLEVGDMGVWKTSYKVICENGCVKHLYEMGNTLERNT